MTSHVVATAGHVDHGKSTLVKALTGMEPDRWAEEKRRGLTIDLGFAWTTLPNGDLVSFVDVPGHEKFLSNTLAGLGAALVVTFVVAADEGWSAQSSDHRDAVAALGIQHGVIAITKTDRATPDRVESVVSQTLEELAGTGLRDAPVVALSVVQGTGLDAYLSTLTRVLGDVDAAPSETRIRFWVDRAFNVAGAGAVVTGTLTAGSLLRGGQLQLLALGQEPRSVTIRGLQNRGDDRASISAVDRAAANLRGINAATITRGDVLVTSGAWHLSSILDVRRVAGRQLTHAPSELRIHFGTANLQARVRAFDADHARLTLEHPLPIALGDRLLLRDAGSHSVSGGVTVLDPDPQAFRRRGEGSRHGERLKQMPAQGDVIHVVGRHGAVRTDELSRLGYQWHHPAVRKDAVQVREIGDWVVSRQAYQDWTRHLRDMVETAVQRDPMTGGLPIATVRAGLGSTGSTFLDQLVVDAGLERRDGLLRPVGAINSMGPHEASMRKLEAQLEEAPFTAPSAEELAALGLWPPQIAAAERQGRILRLSGGVVVLPTTPSRAIRELAQIPQPFTASAARQALGTSRRVIIPLLEYLDSHGCTRRLDAALREVCQ